MDTLLAEASFPRPFIKARMIKNQSDEDQKVSDLLAIFPDVAVWDVRVRKGLASRSTIWRASFHYQAPGCKGTFAYLRGFQSARKGSDFFDGDLHLFVSENGTSPYGIYKVSDEMKTILAALVMREINSGNHQMVDNLPLLTPIGSPRRSFAAKIEMLTSGLAAGFNGKWQVSTFINARGIRVPRSEQLAVARLPFPGLHLQARFSVSLDVSTSIFGCFVLADDDGRMFMAFPPSASVRSTIPPEDLRSIAARCAELLRNPPLSPEARARANRAARADRKRPYGQIESQTQ